MLNVPAEGPVARWFAEPRLTRSIGSGYDESSPRGYFSLEITPKAYDGVVFFERTTAAVPVGARDGPGPRQRLPAPSNLDFERGKPGEPPPDWEFREKLRRFDFEVDERSG